MTTSLNVGSEQLAPDQTAEQLQPAVVPAVFQPHVPLFKHVGLHTARMAVVQLAPDQAAVHVQTAAVPAVFQPHVPLLEHIGLHTATDTVRVTTAEVTLPS